MSHFTRLAARYVVAGNGAHDGLRLIFDLEANGFLDAATCVHCIVVADLDGDQVDEYGPTQIDVALAHLARADYLAGHNICAYDLPLLRRLFDWTPKQDCAVLDTLIAARLILPHLSDLDDQAAGMGDVKLGKLRGHHSIEAWGARLGIAKAGADITDYSVFTSEMRERCITDVAISKKLFQLLQPDGYSRQAMQLEHRVAQICERITATGVPFDIVAADDLRQRWTACRAELEGQLLAQFPGTNLNSRQQIGKLLEERGWIPEKRTEKSGQPKIDDELLERLPTLYPEFAGLAEHYILGRRLGQLASGKRAWMKNVASDCRIHGGLVHIGTPHSRAKHLGPNLAQVPNAKKGKPLANECRALFRDGNGWVFVACDQASLQDRGYAHYLQRFDAGAYGKAFLDGADTHWQSAATLGLINAGTVRDKHSKIHEAIREGAKRFRYAFLYGCGTATAGRIISDTVRAVTQIDGSATLQQQLFGGAAQPSETALKRVGNRALKDFEAGTPGLGRLRQQLQAHARKYGWLPGLDGRRIPVRALYSALNFIVTSSEAIICKRWLAEVYAELCDCFRYGWDGDVVIVLWVHDELVCCCRPEIAAQVGEIMVRHAVSAGKFYRLTIPLAADYKIGRSWAGEPIGNTDISATTPKTEPELIPMAATLSASCHLQETKHATGKITWAEIGEINAGLKREGIAPIDIRIETIDERLERVGIRPDLGDRERRADPGVSDGDGAHQEMRRPDPARVAVAEGVSAASANGAGVAGEQPTSVSAAARHYSGQSHGDSGPKRGQYVGTWIYRHPDQPNYLRVDKHGAGDDKRFYQHHWDGRRWVYGVKGTYAEVKIPYRLPELIAAAAKEPVWICEGEKDADNVAALGLVTTTNPGGAKVFQPELAQWFKGKQIAYILEDNDASGREHTRKILEVLSGIVPNIAVVAFPELAEKGDVSDWLGAGGNRKLLRARAEEAAKRMSQRALRPRPAPIREWDGQPVPELEYAVPDRFPLDNVGLFSGEGGQGKSSLVQQLCVAHGLGLEWLGCIPRLGPSVYVECEDAERVLHWRLKTIAVHYDTTLTAIADAGFQMYPLTDEENTVLATAADKTGIVRPTPLYDWLYELAGDIKPVMIGIASSANVFAGNENVRTEVQQFIRLLRRIAYVAHGTVLLVTQPSLSGIENKSVSHEGLAGTTQWHNAVRARAVMKSVRSEDGIDTGLRMISFHKNQYGPASGSCFVRYQNGLFLPVEGMSMDAAERAAKADEIFVGLLGRFAEQHRTVNHISGRNYAPKMFAEHPDAHGISKREFAQAMERLLNAKVIEVRQWGKASRPTFYLAVVDAE